MKIIYRLYHFLGGLYCAIILLSLATLFVIAGTLLESLNDSHAFAEKYTYGHPLFNLLLWGFFINILFAATRRWPFKKRHIPFLITHCGLLMILGGVLIKNIYGVQGNLQLLEGSSSNRIFIPNSFALHIEDRNREEILPIGPDWKISKSTQFPEIDIALTGKAFHCCEHIQTFIKDDYLHIEGLPLIPIRSINDLSNEISPHKIGPWHLYALRSHDPAATARTLFINTTRIVLTETSTDEPLFTGLLKDVLEHPINIENFPVQFDLIFDWSFPNGFNKPALYMQTRKDLATEMTKTPLCGLDCLRMVKKEGNSHGASTYSVDLIRNPAMLFIEDTWGDIHLFGFNLRGQVHSHSFSRDYMKNLYSYNHGFSGYAIQTEIPFSPYGISRIDREKYLLAYLTKQLKQSLTEPKVLAPPLQWFYACCQQMQMDFSTLFLSFLYEWHQSGTKLYPLNRPLPTPLASLFQMDKSYGMWPEMGAHQFSKELLLHQIYLANIWMSVEEEMLEHLNITQEAPFVIETSIKTNRTPLPSPTKIEDRVPLLLLSLKENAITTHLELSYDKTGQGWKWPGLFGKYLFRFQPYYMEIPYEVRIRNATQVSYPQTQQAYSYECNMLIKDCRSGVESEKTISMNNVYETWEGYRFYLAGLAPTDEQSIKRVHIVVNYDPAKYWMTYPGALFLSLGIVLLFWLKPYSTGKK